MARWKVFIQRGLQGWEWTRPHHTGEPSAAWNGPYRTEGLAKGAARRSIPRVIGKSNPADFEFIRITHGDTETRVAQIKRANDAIKAGDKS